MKRDKAEAGRRCGRRGALEEEWISLLGLCLFVLLRVRVFILRVLPLFPAAGHEAPCRQQPRGVPVARVLHKPGHCQEKRQRPPCAPLLPPAPCSHQPQQHGCAISPGHGDTEMVTGSKAHVWELNVGQAVCRVLGCPPAQLVPHCWPERHHLLPTELPELSPFSHSAGLSRGKADPCRGIQSQGLPVEAPQDSPLSLQSTKRNSAAQCLTSVSMCVMSLTSLFRREFPTSGRFRTSRSGGSTCRATARVTGHRGYQRPQPPTAEVSGGRPQAGLGWPPPRAAP